MIKKTFIISSLLLLGACVSDDPRQGGLIGGIAGLSSGTYDARVAQRQQSLTAVRTMQEGLQIDNARLQQQRNAKLSEIKRTQRQIGALNQEMLSLKQSINSLRRSNKISAQQAQEMQRNATRLEQSIQAQSSLLSQVEQNKSATDLAKVEAKVEALRRQQQEQSRLALIMTQ